MKHLSLFSGIGGFDIAAEWVGWENVAHCEWNDFGKLVLNHHLKNSKSHDDITKTDFTIYRGRVDIVTGGFPCQPYSVAGKRKGKDDERHLWPEMLRAIREIAPRWVVGENVRGIINWDGGVVFDEVQSDMEAEGYEILPFLLPAAGVNAPHERYRTWFIAYSNNTGNSSGLRPVSGANEEIPERNENTESCKSSTGAIKDTNQNGRNGKLREEKPGIGQQRYTGTGDNEQLPSDNGETGIATDNNNKRLERSKNKRSIRKVRQESYKQPSRLFCTNWKDFPTQSPVCNGNDGFSTESLRQRIREDSLGVISEEEIDKILSSAATQWRNETIKAGGNAVVPPLVLQIFKAIQQYDLQNLP